MMADQNDNAYVERIVLDITSPTPDFKGLDGVIRRLGALNRLLDSVKAKSAQLSASIGKSLAMPKGGIGGTGHSSVSAKEMKAPGLFDKDAAVPIKPLKPITPSQIEATGIPLEIRADQIRAFLSGKIEMPINASEIEVRVIGKVAGLVDAEELKKANEKAVADAAGGGGKGGKGGGGGGGGADPQEPDISGRKRIIQTKEVDGVLREFTESLDDLGQKIKTTKISYDTEGNAATSEIDVDRRGAGVRQNVLDQIEAAKSQIRAESSRDLERGALTLAEQKVAALKKQWELLKGIADSNAQDLTNSGQQVLFSKVQASAEAARLSYERERVKISGKSHRDLIAQSISTEKSAAKAARTAAIAAAPDNQVEKLQALSLEQEKLARAYRNAQQAYSRLGDTTGATRMGERAQTATSKSEEFLVSAASIDAKNRQREKQKQLDDQIEQASRDNDARRMRRERAAERAENARKASVEAATRDNDARRLRRQRDFERQRERIADDVYKHREAQQSTLARRVAAAGGDQEAAKRAEAAYQQSMAGELRKQANEASKIGDKKLARRLGTEAADAEMKAQKAMVAANKAAAATRVIGKNMLDNIRHVGQWAASVGVLYGAIGLANSSMKSLVQTGYQTARLQQVFTGIGGNANQLTDDLLRLASVNGRTADEAMESGIQWARLGLTRIQINRAVQVSMMAANVAEISAAEATKQLSAIMAAYQLQVSQLPGVLGQLNAISNTFNVTNAELLQGLSRTASVAQQAGIGLSELIGIIGAGVGTTGQSGANLGNAMKSIAGALSAPDKQKMLRDVFQFEVSDQGGEGLKNMSETLRELYVRYIEMSEAERRSMVFNVAGRHQASRLTAVMDSYIKGQVLAIRAQLNLNSAQSENRLITDTMKSKLQGLSAEWVRFVNNIGTSGPKFKNAMGDFDVSINGILTEATDTLTNMLRLANSPVGGGILSGMTILAGVLTARLAIAAVHLNKLRAGGTLGATDPKLNGLLQGRTMVLGNTATAMAQALERTSLTMRHFLMNGTRFERWIGGTTGLMRGWGRSLSGSAAIVGYATRAIAVGLDSITFAVGGLIRALPALAVIGATVWVVSKGIEYFSGSGERANDILDQYTMKAEEAARAADAAGMSVRLFGTAMKSIENSRTAKERENIFTQSVEAGFTTESGDNEAARKRKLEELNAVRARGVEIIRSQMTQEEQNAKLAEIYADLSARAEKRKQLERQRTFELNTKAREELLQERRAIETKSPKATKFVFTSQAEMLSEIDAKLAELDGKKIKLAIEVEEDNAAALDQFRQSEAFRKMFTERQEFAEKLMGESFGAVRAEGATEQFAIDVLKAREMLRIRERTLDLVKQERAEILKKAGSNIEEEKILGQHVKSLEEKQSRLRAEAGMLEQQVGGRGYALKDLQEQSPGGYDFSRASDDQKGMLDYSQKMNNGRGLREVVGEINLVSKEIDDLSKKLYAVKTAPGFEANTAKIQELTESIGNARNELRRLTEEGVALNFAEFQDRIAIATRIATAEGNNYGQGGNDAKRLIDQYNRLKQEARFSFDQASDAGSDTIAQNQFTASVIKSGQAIDALIRGREMLLELQAREKRMQEELTREYQKTLLTASPAELLRKLAIQKLTGKDGGITGGQFFGLSTEGRRETLQRPEFNLEIREIRGMVKDLKNAGFGRPVEDIQEEAARLRRQAAAAQAAMPRPQVPNSMLNENATTAAAKLGELGNATQRLITVFNNAVNQLRVPQYGVSYDLPDSRSPRPPGER